MPWFQVDDTLATHPKARQAGLAAMGLWAVSGAYSMQHLTEGHVPDWYVNSWPSGRRLAAKLVAARLWVVVKDGWKFHQWEDIQRTKEEVEADRAANRDRQRKWREKQRREALAAAAKAAADTPGNPPSNDATNTVTGTGSNTVTNTVNNGPQAKPSQPSITNYSSEGGERTSTRDPQDPLPEHCPEHPDGTDEPCGPCAGLRKRREAQTRDTANAERDRLAAAARTRAECPRCDENGFTLDPDTAIPTGRCDHAPIGANA